MTLGNRIQNIRTAHGMSQEQFGELLNTTRQTVSKWELDQVIPEIRKIVAISRYFCISTDDLLLNVTNFEKEGVRFSCGVYRSSNAEIVETEKLAIEYYSRGKSVLGAKLYEGNGEGKRMVAICERDCKEAQAGYAYLYEDEKGAEQVATNCEELSAFLGEEFKRERLQKMERMESFLVNHGEFQRHTVSEIGLRQCLEEWRKGVTAYNSADEINVVICTGKTEYVYSIHKAETDIYCGCSYNVPMELGLRSYGQFFRLRNYGDNSQEFCRCVYDFDYKMPEIEKKEECVKLGCSLHDNTWFVKRYCEDEIVLAGCGNDEYIYRRNEEKFERFV